MQCLKQFKSDRTCDMCDVSNNDLLRECKGNYDGKIVLNQKLREIASKCPYRVIASDEYDDFYACNKNGHGWGRDADDCRCTIKCEQYLQQIVS